MTPEYTLEDVLDRVAAVISFSTLDKSLPGGWSILSASRRNRALRIVERHTSGVERETTLCMTSQGAR